MTDANDKTNKPQADIDAAQSQSESIETLTQAAAVVLSMVKIEGPPVLTALAGGANNRVYRVDVPKGSLVLKVYFEHPKDTRDRMDAEFSFLKHVWGMGLRCVPQPVARLPLRQLALYTFIKGKSFVAGDVTAEHVTQAADFACAVNVRRDELAGQNHSGDLITEERPVVAHASDACFTLAHHLGSIEQRISQLIAMDVQDTHDEQAIAFVQGDLSAVWKQAVSKFRTKVEQASLDLHQPVDEGDRVLSPSDFGFHNAVLQEDGQVGFVDFEYAGWDDPAKLVCDFFTQEAVPVQHEHLALFMERFGSCLHKVNDVQKRVELLLPLYQVKWSAMALNDFLPVSKERRAFAHQQPVDEKRKAAQLEKAKELLSRVS